jgi:DNA polymerase V
MQLPVLPCPLNAGFPSPADDWVEKRLDLNDLLLLHPLTSFYAQVKGDSMRDAGIQDGDIVIVDRALEPGDTSIVVARLGEEFTIKRLRLFSDAVILHAAHSDYPPVEVTHRIDFHVWGVVTCVIHPLAFSFPHQA